MNNQIQFPSLKKYSAEIYTNALKTVLFPNYNTFSNVNVAYSDLLSNISDTTDNVVPIKEIRIKIAHKSDLIMRSERLYKLERNISKSLKNQIFR